MSITTAEQIAIYLDTPLAELSNNKVLFLNSKLGKGAIKRSIQQRIRKKLAALKKWKRTRKQFQN